MPVTRRKVMKKLFLLLLAAAAVIGFQVSPAVEAGDDLAAANHVPGGMLVKYRHGAETRGEAPTRDLGGPVATEITTPRWQHIRLPEHIKVADAILMYKQHPDVELAQPNFIYRINLTPNDERFGQLYGMLRISAPQAWDVTTGDPSVVVAVVDTGIERDHPD